VPETAEEAGRLLDRWGFAFLFAPALHASMHHAGPVRGELGVRTVFNILGPLTNPAGAEHQLLGVYDPARVETLAEVLAELGAHHALVVHGGGLDEIALHAPTVVAEVRDGRVSRYVIDPAERGFPQVDLDAVRGGDPAYNAERAREILRGEPGPAAEMVAVNAGYALYAADRVTTPEDGIVLARETLAAGRAWQLVETLQAESGGAA
jgi:anthranilate phosphoribosyltransferase